VLLTLPMAAAVIWLDRWQGRGSWLAWATGLLIKAQAIVLAPLIYAATLRRYGSRGFVTGVMIALSLIVALSAPLVLLGEGPGLYQTVVGSVGRFPQVTNRAYNLWWLVVGDQRVSDLTEWAGMSYRTLGFLLVGAAALLVMLAVLRHPHPHTYLVGAAALGLAFFTLPTQIHERYAFFALPFLLLASAADPRLLLPYAVLATNATINIFGAIGSFTPELMPLIHNSALPQVVAWVNLATLAGLLIYLYVVPQGSAVSQSRNNDGETRFPRAPAGRIS
jgi:Gpi18-like mannosyltransferase